MKSDDFCTYFDQIYPITNVQLFFLLPFLCILHSMLIYLLACTGTSSNHSSVQVVETFANAVPSRPMVSQRTRSYIQAAPGESFINPIVLHLSNTRAAIMEHDNKFNIERIYG